MWSHEGATDARVSVDMQGRYDVRLVCNMTTNFELALGLYDEYHFAIRPSANQHFLSIAMASS
jgi:hypothetical protein